jgi:hypothetical protein
VHAYKGVCVHPGCTTNAQNWGLCGKHGGDPRAVCVHPGCTTKAKAHGLCYKPGELGVRPEPDCTPKVQAKGWCSKHDKVKVHNPLAAILGKQ